MLPNEHHRNMLVTMRTGQAYHHERCDSSQYAIDIQAEGEQLNSEGDSLVKMSERLLTYDIAHERGESLA